MKTRIWHSDRALRVLLCSALLAAGAICAGAQPAARTLESLCGKTVASSVRTIGKVVRVAFKGEPSLIPDHPAAGQLRAAIAGGRSAILVETLFALHRPKPADPAAVAAELATIYGHLRAVGSLEGIEYWSASRNELRTFYAESFRIDGPDSRGRLADPAPPSPGQIPPAESLFAFQRDLSFGSNVYRYDYSSTGETITVTQTNLTGMKYGILPVMAPGGMSTRVFIVRAEDAIVFYAGSGADASGIFRQKLEVSFSNRAEALFRWFESRMGK